MTTASGMHDMAFVDLYLEILKLCFYRDSRDTPSGQGKDVHKSNQAINLNRERNRKAKTANRSHQLFHFYRGA